ncbi:hypothetical protein Tco_0548643 [Tanacetum coccineum]
MLNKKVTEPWNKEKKKLGHTIMDGNLTKKMTRVNFWKTNHKIGRLVIWKTYRTCGVCILELKDGTVIYMLVERRYPLSKELLQRMLDLGLELED